MNKFVIGLVLGISCLVSYEIFAASRPAKYESNNYDAQSVVVYGETTNNVIMPILINASGAVVTTTSS